MGTGFLKERFRHVVYCEHGGTGNGSSSASPRAIDDADIMTIDAGTVVERCYVLLDTAITGTTVLTVGDDDDADGYVEDLAGSFATPGMYSWDAKTTGDYLRVETAGATDAADIYVVPTAKYYSAAGKEVKLATTTASTAGKFRVVVEGYRVGANA